MTIGLGQTQQMRQQMVMTQQLRMAIEMLQMNRQEMSDLIHAQLAENPVLEIVEPGVEGAGPVTAAELMREVGAPSEAPPMERAGVGAGRENGDGEGIEAPGGMGATLFDVGESPLPVSPSAPGGDLGTDDAAAISDDIFAAGAQLKNEPEMDWDRFFEHQQEGPSEGQNLAVPDLSDRTPIEERLSRVGGLADHLTWQVELSRKPIAERAIAREIIGNLDPDGFLRESTLDEIAAATGATLAEVERVHAWLMRLDPTGVAARTVPEALMVQARELRPTDGMVQTLLRDHWDALLRRQFARIAKTLRCTEPEIEKAVAFIATLNPRPGALFGAETPEYVEPDLRIFREGKEWRVELNESGLPRLRLSRAYARILKERDKAASGARAYVRERLSKAEWLLDAIRQRNETILKVARAIVARQSEFLERGVTAKRPLILRDIAEDTGLSESTVSRVTTKKYADTPAGLVELKDFFSTGIENAQGDSVSSDAIQERIRSLVEAEDPRKPLSDDQLMHLLARENIKVARRTIAKYRDQLNIPTSVQRRRG